MAIEQELNKTNPLHKEFQSLLEKDFKDRKLKENEIIKAAVTEITKNFIVVDCKAKMEGMIPVEEFKNDDELSKLKIGSTIDVYLDRIESAKGEIVISRDKARKMKAWKKMEKVFETQEELTGYITGKIKGGFIATVDGLPCFMPSSQIDVRPLKKVDHLMNTPVKVIATRIDKNRGNVCVSRRAVLEKSKNAEISEALKNIKDDSETVTKKVMRMYTDPSRLRATDPGHVEGNPVFMYHDAFNPDIDEVDDLKKRYVLGKVGDVEVKTKLATALNQLMDPWRERRDYFETHPELVIEALRSGTEHYRTKAQETMEMVRGALKLDYLQKD